MSEYKKELLMTREINVPREKAFRAWLKPELVKQWWGPKGVTIPVCEIEAKPGGKINIVMEAGEELGKFKGMKWPMEGKFVEISEPEKIVFTANAINNGTTVLEHLTTVTFTEANGTTTMKVHVEVTKVNPGGEFAVAGMEQGWNEQFNKLVEFLKK